MQHGHSLVELGEITNWRPSDTVRNSSMQVLSASSPVTRARPESAEIACGICPSLVSIEVNMLRHTGLITARWP